MLRSLYAAATGLACNKWQNGDEFACKYVNRFPNYGYGNLTTVSCRVINQALHKCFRKHVEILKKKIFQKI